MGDELPVRFKYDGDVYHHYGCRHALEGGTSGWAEERESYVEPTRKRATCCIRLWDDVPPSKRKAQPPGAAR